MAASTATKILVAYQIAELLQELAQLILNWSYYLKYLHYEKVPLRKQFQVIVACILLIPFLCTVNEVWSLMDELESIKENG